MLDEKKYLNGIRLVLSQKKHYEIAQMLEGATCSINVSNSFSRKRWDCYYTTVQFYVRWQYLEEFTETVREVLLEVADKVMPKNEQLDVMDIEISPNLDEIPDGEVEVNAIINGKNYIPLFGTPSSDTSFQCDVFMIMPFAPEFDPIYRKIVVPTVSELGLSIKRGDDPFSKHEIMYEVWSMLNACKLVIADCTGRNPNVFYELGIAHTIGKPVIMLTQNLMELPFDVRNRRAIEYDTAFHKIDSLKQQLSIAIHSVLPKPKDEFPF